MSLFRTSILAALSVIVALTGAGALAATGSSACQLRSPYGSVSSTAILPYCVHTARRLPSGLNDRW